MKRKKVTNLPLLQIRWCRHKNNWGKKKKGGNEPEIAVHPVVSHVWVTLHASFVSVVPLNQRHCLAVASQIDPTVHTVLVSITVPSVSSQDLFVPPAAAVPVVEPALSKSLLMQKFPAAHAAPWAHTSTKIHTAGR